MIVLTLYLVFGGEPDDEDAIDNDDEDDGSSDGNQFNDHRHMAMILWPGYFDTEVSFTPHCSYHNQAIIIWPYNRLDCNGHPS